MAQCAGSINIMTARERLRIAKESEDRTAYKAAWEELLTAQEAHRNQTGCTEVH